MQTAFEATNPFALNPFEFWAKANMAAVAATMELFKSSTTAATSLLSNAAAAPDDSRSARREVAPASYEARVAEIHGSAARSSTAKSWYRAPYRSPYDPLFWMTPGHPADHVGDWVRPAMAAGSALANPFASPFSVPFATPFGGSFPDWQSAAWMSPMTIWANMMPTSTGGSGAVARATANVVDFETAYAAYRTAGGHASAQIQRAPQRPSTPGRGPEAEEARLSIWGFPFAMFGWPPRLS